MTTLNTSFIGSFTNLNNMKYPLLNYKRNMKLKKVIKVVAMYKGTYDREKKLTEMIENKVTEAKEVCDGNDGSDECKVAWDEVEEISQAKAHLRDKLEHHEDPLESFCDGNPDTDECSVYYD
ncbi:hypothetical protein CTI12_AA021290 [Artemisia annua]|uniref:CP12 domain-containing protein n=1 Tax=Artemisia annua TaxID=35608 RepID=A0A2U1QJY3_ARTAN|nr:hypothetical protein CTI12_AA021290 [Artemisia annua]